MCLAGILCWPTPHKRHGTPSAPEMWQTHRKSVTERASGNRCQMASISRESSGFSRSIKFVGTALWDRDSQRAHGTTAPFPMMTWRPGSVTFCVPYLLVRHPLANRKVTPPGGCRLAVLLWQYIHHAKKPICPSRRGNYLPATRGPDRSGRAFQQDSASGLE